VFSRIKKEGDFVLSSGVKSDYTYEYGDLSDAMNEAYCEVLLKKLLDWQKQHGKFDVVVGCETQGIRIGHQHAEKAAGLRSGRRDNLFSGYALADCG